MDLATLLELCKAYEELGTTVQRQLIKVTVYGEPLEDMNGNALALAKDFLKLAARHDVADAAQEAELIEEHLREVAV